MSMFWTCMEVVGDIILVGLALAGVYYLVRVGLGYGLFLAYTTAACGGEVHELAYISDKERTAIVDQFHGGKDTFDRKMAAGRGPPKVGGVQCYPRTKATPISYDARRAARRMAEIRRMFEPWGVPDNLMPDSLREARRRRRNMDRGLRGVPENLMPDNLADAELLAANRNRFANRFKAGSVGRNVMPRNMLTHQANVAGVQNGVRARTYPPPAPTDPLLDRDFYEVGWRRHGHGSIRHDGGVAALSGAGFFHHRHLFN
jgi:hypothetical protein